MERRGRRCSCSSRLSGNIMEYRNWISEMIRITENGSPTDPIYVFLSNPKGRNFVFQVSFARRREEDLPAAMAANPPKETYPLFTLSSSNSFGLGLFGSSERLLPPPPPSVEVLLSEGSSPANSSVDSVVITDGLALLKGRVSTSDVFGVSNSDLIPGKYEGGLKLWEGSLDLVKNLKLEVEHDQLRLRGKRVLELGCGHGLPGIFACLEGAASVHFQDFNAEVLRCLTIPNVKYNISEEKLGQDNCLTKETEKNVSLDVRFFAGDWREIHHLLLHGCDDECHKAKETSVQHSWNGYDIILMAETVYSLSSVQHLYDLIKKCLRHPHGVVYLAGKKHYFGVGGGTPQFLHLVSEDGSMAAELLAEVADGSSNVREVWKLAFKASDIKENGD